MALVRISRPSSSRTLRTAGPTSGSYPWASSSLLRSTSVTFTPNRWKHLSELERDVASADDSERARQLSRLYRLAAREKVRAVAGSSSSRRNVRWPGPQCLPHLRRNEMSFVPKLLHSSVPKPAQGFRIGRSDVRPQHRLPDNEKRNWTARLRQNVLECRGPLHAKGSSRREKSYDSRSAVCGIEGLFEREKTFGRQ